MMDLLQHMQNQASDLTEKLILQFRLDPIAKQVKARGLTYLADRKLLSLATLIEHLNREGIRGDVYEFGIALGGSSILLASKMGERRYHGFDVFGMIPPPSPSDELDSHERYAEIKAGHSRGIGESQYYGYIDNLYDVVDDNFRSFGLSIDGKKICMHKGLFEDTLLLANTDRICLAHIDCDWYDSVKFCLNKLADNIILGGLIIIDDFNCWQGCRKATCEFLDQDKRFILEKNKPHAVLVKNAN